MRIWVAALVLIGLWTHRASACKCCDPCHKYEHLNRVPVEQLAPSYVAVAASLGAHPKRADVMRVLAGARFVAEQKGVRALRLVDGAHVPDTIDHGDGARVEIVHDLALRHGHFQVTLGGSIYTISRCIDDKHRASTCLSR